MFSNDWNEQYKNNAQMSVWPWSDLVSMYMRHVKPFVKPNVKVLELGVGAGANISFFKALNVDYYAIEGSPFIVGELKKTHGDFAKNIIAADFTQEIPFDQTFDVIIDRSSLTHNTTKDIENCIRLLTEKMANDAYFIGIDWFSLNHSGLQFNQKQLDENTFSNFNGGNFVGVGDVHFSDDKHIKRLFSSFQLKALEHKQNLQFIPTENYNFATWNFIAQRDSKHDT